MDDLPKLMELAEYATSIIVGPGLGLMDETAKTVREFVKRVCKFKPLVLDADALKAISKEPINISGSNTVLTPHVGEFSMLTGVNLAPPERIEERMLQVMSEAKKFGVVILLKAHEDIISDGKRCKVNWTGNPGMTVGGTGDVLAGITATLLSWGVQPFRAACASAFINGMAGDLAVKERGYHIMATDVIEKIPEVFRKFEKTELGTLSLKNP